MIFWIKFAQKGCFRLNQKKWTPPLNSAYSNKSWCQISAETVNSDFLTKFAQKGCFASKTEKVNTTIEFCIFELVYVPSFSLSWQFWCFFCYFCPNLPKSVFPVENGKIALARASMVLLLVAETASCKYINHIRTDFCWFATSVTQFYFFEYTRPVGKKFFISSSDGKDGISPYLLNLIFEFFSPLHFMCILFLQCDATILKLA